LGPEARAQLLDALAGDELERRIGIDLGVEGLLPRLHLPMLAGLAQGPGFPNLSCLGLLSDRVLRSYVDGLGSRARDQLGERRQLV
jgi:mycobactin lysine-N-oxygenase